MDLNKNFKNCNHLAGHKTSHQRSHLRRRVPLPRAASGTAASTPSGPAGARNFRADHPTPRPHGTDRSPLRPGSSCLPRQPGSSRTGQCVLLSFRADRCVRMRGAVEIGVDFGGWWEWWVGGGDAGIESWQACMARVSAARRRVVAMARTALAGKEGTPSVLA